MEKLTAKLVAKNDYPVKVLQFGEGNFMRAFVDWQIQQMNKQGLFEGDVVVVQPISQGLGGMLAEQDNQYTVILEGLLNGEIVNESEVISVINDVINPYENWQAYLSLADSDDLEIIVSNTTEAGIQYVAGDKLEDAPQKSFPGKLTAFLYARYQAGKKGLTIIPCELIDRNGEKLKEVILQYAADWCLPEDFVAWLNEENVFCCSLVDRIVPGYPRDSAAELNEKHGYEDNLMVKAEPFLLWVIEGPASLKETFPLAKAGLNVIVTDNMTPYRERKVHLLNGPHTAMVPVGMLAGVETVEDVMKDADFRPFVDRLFAEELIPMLALPQAELEEYAEQIKERFLNPFVHHQLLAIALNSVSKYRARLLPIVKKYIAEKQAVPVRMATSLAGIILSYRGDVIAPTDDADVIEIFQKAWQDETTVVKTILANEQLWGEDLTQLPLLTDYVEAAVKELEEKSARTVIQELEGAN